MSQKISRRQKTRKVLFLAVSIAILLAFVPTNRLYHFSQLAAPILEECMFHSRLFRKVFCLLCFAFAVCLSDGLAGFATAQSSDETAVRAVVEQYYRLYVNKDVNGLLQLWDAQAPDFKTLKSELEKQFATQTFTLKQLTVSQVVLEGEKASLRATVELTVQAVANQPVQPVQQVQNVRLVRSSEMAWKVQQNVSAFEQLVAALEKATTEAEQTRLLTEESVLVRGELLSLLGDMVNRQHTQGQYAKARGLAELGLVLSKKIANRRGEARFLNLLGSINYGQDRYDEALAYYQSTLAILEELGLKPNFAVIQSNIGNVHSSRGNYTLAMDYYQQSLNTRKELGDKAGMSASYINIGVNYYHQGLSDSALESYGKALRLKEELGDKEGIGRLMNNMGIVFSGQGEYEKALEVLFRSQKIAEDMGRKPMLLESLGSIGNVYSNLRREDLALSYFRKVLALAEEMGATNRVAETLGNMGTILHSQGNYSQALQLNLRALGIAEELGAKGSIALAMNDTGMVYLALEQNERALDYLQKSLKLSEEIGERRAIVSSLFSLGTLYFTEKRFQEALEPLERAKQVAEEADLTARLWEIQKKIGETLHALGQPKRARESLEQSIQSLEVLRRQNVGGEAQQQNFFIDKAEAYFALADLSIERHSEIEAFSLAERSKASVLLDVLQHGRVRVNKNLLPTELKEEKEAQAQLVMLNTQLTRETQKTTPDLTKIPGLKAQIEQARLEIEALQTRLYVAHPELKVKRGALTPIALSETTALLDDKAALLEFLVGEDKTYLFVITLRNNKPVLQTFTLPVTRRDLTAKTEQLRKYLAGRNLGYVEPARALYDLLLKPAAAQLLGKTRLVIIPDGPLWELPFQALMPAANHFLVEDKTISTAPSLTFLREMVRVREQRGKQTTPANILAIGNPALGGVEMLAKRAELMGDKLEPLPFAEQQAVQLGQLYKTNAKVLIGAAATESAVKAEMGKYQVLHLATHGVLDDRNPMYSHLVLAQTGNDEKGDGQKEDGLLEARELLDMDLQAELAVLSACETGRGKIGAGEGMIGLTWALFVAGVPSTIVSQWKVADQSTADLMITFHRQWQTNKLSKAAALRQASLALLKRPATKHPFYWAGFVLVGAD